MSIDTSDTKFDASKFNPFVPPQRDNPYPIYAHARKEQPVFYSPVLDRWIVTRYDDVEEVLKDPVRFSSSENISPSSPLHPAAQEVLKGGYPNFAILVNTDPPEHARIRGLLAKALSLESVAAMEPRIQNIADELIDQFVNEGCADLLTQYCMLLPIMVTIDILGCPATDRDTLKRFFADIVALLWGEPLPLELQLACAHNFVAYQHYMASLVETRRLEPKDDVLSKLVEARLEKEVSLSTEEIVNLVIVLLFAGNTTTGKSLANSLMLMLSHQDQLQALREDFSLVDKFIEESLRMEMSVKGLTRTTTKAVEIGGVSIPAGAHLHVLLASASHDETYFPNPERFEINRENLAHKHFAFGRGIHHCIGASLARLEGRITIETLLRRLPNLRLQPNQTLEFDPSMLFRGLKHLYVEWDAVVEAKI